MGAADWREGYAPAYVHMHMSQGRKASQRGGSKCILSKSTLCLTWGLSNTFSFFLAAWFPFCNCETSWGFAEQILIGNPPMGESRSFTFSLLWHGQLLEFNPCSADPDWEPVHISWSLSSCNDAILCLEPFKNLVLWHQSFSPSLNPQKSARAG